MDVFRLLDRSNAVRSFDVVEQRTWRTGSYLRLRIVLSDGSDALNGLCRYERSRSVGPSWTWAHMGSNYTWIVEGTKDLAGSDRKTYGGKFGSAGEPLVDMGSYEAPLPPPARGWPDGTKQ